MTDAPQEEAEPLEVALARHKMDMERAESRRRDRQQTALEKALEKERLIFVFAMGVLLTPILYVLPEKDYLLVGASAAPLTAYVGARGIWNRRMLAGQIRRTREDGD